MCMTWRVIPRWPEVAGHISGGVEVDASALPSAASGDFDIDISLVVDIDFSKKAGPQLMHSRVNTYCTLNTLLIHVSYIPNTTVPIKHPSHVQYTRGTHV